jgi:hypothetical protein
MLNIIYFALKICFFIKCILMRIIIRKELKTEQVLTCSGGKQEMSIHELINQRNVNQEVTHMLKKLLVSIVCTFFVSLTTHAQVTIEGTVTDAETGEELPGVNVVVEELDLGMPTDADASYEIPDVPAGTYQQMRLRLGWARIETLDGRVFSTEDGTLHCPSCAQSGLKIKFRGGGLRLEEGEQNLIVDFDVSQSFGRERGRSGRWVMHPVITATRAEAAGSIVGTVELGEGVTLPVCGGSQTTLASFVPTATAGEVSLSGSTNAEGEFRFPFVASGIYTIGFEDEVVFANGDRLVLAATPSVGTVDVATGSSATVDFTITSAECEEDE